MNVPLFIVVCILCVIVGLVAGWYAYKVIGDKRKKKSDEDVIKSQVSESTERGTIEESEAVMINNIFEFGDKVAKDIMTDRSNIISLEGSMRLTDAIELMLDNAYSRFPVCDDNIDRIIGIIHIKDAIKAFRDKNNRKKPIVEVENLMREAKFIPETRKVDDLFRAMRAKKYQMVIVVDEYGQTAGIVAMRDMLEEIVGDIDDEYDDDNGFIVAENGNKYVIEGLTALEDLEECLKVKFDDENFETINGYLISKMEHIPDKKEKFEMDYEGYHFKVLSVENNMIKQILVTKIVNNDTTVSDTPEEKGNQ